MFNKRQDLFIKIALVACMVCLSGLPFDGFSKTIQLIESNKATVPSWISLDTEKIYWLDQKVEFVFARSGLRNLNLGVKQTELNAKYSFARTLSLHLLRMMLEQGKHFTLNDQKVLKKALVNIIDRLSYPKIVIADIYYRKWKSLKTSEADSIDVYCLAYLDLKDWQELKDSIGKELKRHSSTKVRGLWQSLF